MTVMKYFGGDIKDTHRCENMESNGNVHLRWECEH